jgi:hypothetical protein
LKLGNGLIFGVSCYVFVSKNRANGFFHPVPNVCDLKKLRQAGHEDSRKGQQDQRGPAPDNIVDGTVDAGNRI